MATTTISSIPKQILELIPLYGGDKRQLNLYLRKCQYVIDRYNGDEEQNLYVYNVLTSRLKDDAAALLSEREDITTWSALKAVLTQHFGDPRSEQCINLELESLKINPDESFLDFCNRIQGVRSLLMSKVNAIDDPELKQAKSVIYNNTALNVFLYNLPENMVRIVRLKSPSTLESALSIVLEEVNFSEQYKMRNRMHSNSQSLNSGYKPPQQLGYKPQQPLGYKPPQQLGYRPSQQLGYKPPQQLGYRPPQQLGYRPPQQFGYKPPQQFGYRPPQQFGYRPPHQFGYRPPQQFGYKSPQEFGYRPPQQFGYKPPQQFGYKPPQPQQQINDVSMRTAQPKMQQGFKLNELTDYDDSPCEEYYCYDNDDSNDVNNYYDNDYSNDINYCYDRDAYQPEYSNPSGEQLEPTNDVQKSLPDFQVTASVTNKKS